MRHGKDTTINKGVTFDVFVDGNHTVTPAAAPASVAAAPQQQQQPVRPLSNTAPGVMTVSAPATSVPAPPAPANPVDQATLAVTSDHPGADIEINGNFVGSTPTAVKVAPGQYTVAVRRGTQVWQRVLQVNAGSSVTLNAQFETTDNVAIRRSRNN
jgi:hypothetical protein